MATVPNLLLFSRMLRVRGLDVSSTDVVDAVTALGDVGLARRDDVRHTLRAILVRRRDDLAVFDATFEAFWRDDGERWGRRDLRALGEPRDAVTVSVETVIPEVDTPPEPPHESGRANELPDAEVRTWSGHETLRDTDFADMTADEQAEAERLLTQMTWSPGARRTRRWRPGAGSQVDLRRAWRRGIAQGELLRLPTRARTTEPRPLVLLADVSGSMERYSRMLLRFAHVLMHAQHHVEAFVFSTRLTRVTLELRTRRAGEAVRAAGRRVEDWSGGTRIGDVLRTFHVRWARSVLRRGAVVVIVSDGWDRGEPSVLTAQVARLQRSCARLVWLSPLLGTADYRPLTRGLVAALPYVDDFLPARTLSNLEDVAAQLNHLPPSRRRPRRNTISSEAAPWTEDHVGSASLDSV